MGTNSFLGNSSTTNTGKNFGARYQTGEGNYTYFDPNPDTFDINTAMQNQEFSDPFLGVLNKDLQWWNSQNQAKQEKFGDRFLSGTNQFNLKHVKRNPSGFGAEFGDFGSARDIAGLGDVDSTEWNDFITGLISSGDSTPQLNNIRFTDSGEFMDPNQAGLVNQGLIGQFDQSQLDSAAAINAAEVAETERLDLRFSQDDADDIWSQGVSDQGVALGSFYANDPSGKMSGTEYAQAGADWTAFLDSNVGDTDQTYRQFYGTVGTIPEIGPAGFVVRGDSNISDDIMHDLFGSFADWKSGQNLMGGDAAGGESGDAVVADDLNVDDAIAAITDYFSGDRYENYQAALDTGITSPEDAEAKFDEIQGSDTSRTDEEIRAAYPTLSDDEIDKLFTGSYAPTQNAWETFGRPEASALGTMTGGGLGGARAAASQKEQSAQDASRLAARSSFDTAMFDRNSQQLALQENAIGNRNTLQQNIKTQKTSYLEQVKSSNNEYLKTALTYAKTPAEVAEAYSRVGVNMASTDKIRTDAANVIWDQTLEDSQNWSQLGMTEANMNYINSQTQYVDTQSLFNLYQLAAAEGGFDANTLSVMSNNYMQNQAGLFGNPVMATLLALADMTTMASYGDPGESGGLLGGIL